MPGSPRLRFAWRNLIERAGTRNLRERSTSDWPLSSMTSPASHRPGMSPGSFQPPETTRYRLADRTRSRAAPRAGSCRRGRLLKRFDDVSRSLPTLETLLVGAHVCVAELA